MKKYTLIEHTADIRLFVQADSLQELFFAALQGMASIISHQACQTLDLPLTQEITLKSPDITALLIDFLSDVLTLSHTHKAVFCHATFKMLTDNHLEALVYGTLIASFDEDIKAVTYHEAEIIKKDGLLSTMIVFDI